MKSDENTTGTSSAATTAIESGTTTGDAKKAADEQETRELHVSQTTSEPFNDANTRSSIVELAALFVTALFLRLAFNFLLPHVNNFASCDAFEYINNAQALLQTLAQPASFWQKSAACLSGIAGSADWLSVRNALLPMKDFYISGPVYPAFLAAIIAITGGTVANVHYLWPALLSGNSAISALTCVFIALLGYESFGRKNARIAGLIAAFYPGFIVNSGRLYSETFATFLLTALCYLTLLGFRNRGNNFWLCFLSGFISAALQLTRSVMVVLSLLLLPLTAIQQKGLRRIGFIVPFSLGFMLIALPWLGFQKLAFGAGGLVVDRVGHYNFFIGNNVDTQGWLSYPYPDGRNVDAHTFPQLIQQAIKKSPSRWFRLMLDKPLRLFEYPWNDFRTSIGFWNYRWQSIYHDAMLLLAALGIGLLLLLQESNSAPPDRRQFCGRVFLAGLFTFHFIYCLFITVPRYNLTAIPELIIFASAGALYLFQLVREQTLRKDGLILLASLLLFFILINNNLLPFFVQIGATADSGLLLQTLLRVLCEIACLALILKLANQMQGSKRLATAMSISIALLFAPLLILPPRANGRLLEWYQDLSSSSRSAVKQTIKVPLALCKHNENSWFLLIDTADVRQIASGLELSVNGEKIDAPILPSMSFAENFDRFLDLGNNSVQREGERMWDSLTNSAACGNLDLRQWSIVPLPQSIVQHALKQAETEHLPNCVLDLSLTNHSQEPLRVYGSYVTKKNERIIPSLDVYSWEKVFYGVENPDGLSDTRYDIKLADSILPSVKQDLSDLPGLQNGVFNVELLTPPPATTPSPPPAPTTPSPPSAPTTPSPPPAPTSPLASTKTKVRSLSNNLLAPSRQNEYLNLLASFKLEPSTVRKNHPVNLDLDLGNLASTSPKESIWVIRLRGKTRVRTGNACPEAEIMTEYQSQLTTGQKSFTYKSAWSPRHLSSTRDWNDFAFVVPVKPTVDGARIMKATTCLKVVSPDSPYLNINSQFEGEPEFKDLSLDVFSLPANPIGIGHQVY